jgi:hypothetical protein
MEPKIMRNILAVSFISRPSSGILVSLPGCGAPASPVPMGTAEGVTSIVCGTAERKIVLVAGGDVSLSPSVGFSVLTIVTKTVLVGLLDFAPLVVVVDAVRELLERLGENGSVKAVDLGLGVLIRVTVTSAAGLNASGACCCCNASWSLMARWISRNGIGLRPRLMPGDILMEKS